MSVDYKQKYLKYKNKYLELINEINTKNLIDDKKAKNRYKNPKKSSNLNFARDR